MILDIREDMPNKIQIVFDTSGDALEECDNGLRLNKNNGELTPLCAFDDIDNFIKATEKARELWKK